MEKVSAVGGVFALLTLVHFAVDWIFQSHDEAMKKHDHAQVRAKHCLVYTFPFAMILFWFTDATTAFVLTFVVFFSHFVEDTYLPVFLWAKYVRRPPQMRWELGVDTFGHTYMKVPEGYVASTDGQREGKDLRTQILSRAYPDQASVRNAQRELDRIGFLEFVSAPLGKILMIAVDQIIHIVFLVPVAMAIVLT